MRSYRLICTGCGAHYDDDGSRLQCANDHAPALLRSQYAQRAFRPRDEDSVLRYADWLPDARAFATGAQTGVYRSTALAAKLGLRRLWIAFSGWWPQRGATLPTGSFKDLEAVSVLRRQAPDDSRSLVISSAGNTALAFARACSENDVPALIVVPMRGWQEVMRHALIGPSVHVVAISDAGYDEATAFARELCRNDEFILEGGVRNVGRRDGMGTAMLAAVEAIGALPDVYVQAVGSAAGALAAHEAALRIIGDGRFGTRLPRLLLGQNAPFAPIHDAWQAHRSTLLERDAAATAAQLAQLGAFVLGNQAPPYAVAGGIREALVASGGASYAITNAGLRNAMALFAELEGIDVEPAAGVAIAALAAAVDAGAVAADATVLLHVTGGGRHALSAGSAASVTPALVLARGELATTAIGRTRSLVA
ncbi:MAG: cysteate synthase [Candidatus Velthaea sp.]|jgi:cysteate synthase